MHPGFALALVFTSLILTVGYVLKMLIEARYGPQRRQAEASEHISATRQVELLSNENIALKKQLGRLEERVAVLERIVTDEGRRLAQEIESLHLPRN